MNQDDDEAMKEEAEDNGHAEKFVPVVESIRYRKRAQLAEKKAGELESELGRFKSERDELISKVEALKLENTLIGKLTRAGATDIEAAMLIAKSRLSEEGAEAEKVIASMKAEKHYLFAKEPMQTAGKTAGVRERTAGAGSVLDRAARAALKGGTRAHVQEYLKIRRNYV